MQSARERDMWRRRYVDNRARIFCKITHQTRLRSWRTQITRDPKSSVVVLSILLKFGQAICWAKFYGNLALEQELANPWDKKLDCHVLVNFWARNFLGLEVLGKKFGARYLSRAGGTRPCIAERSYQTPEI